MEGGIGFRGQQGLQTGKGTHFLTSCPAPARARHLPKLCKSVFTVSPCQVQEVQEPAQDHTALAGQSKELLARQGPMANVPSYLYEARPMA